MKKKVSRKSVSVVGGSVHVLMGCKLASTIGRSDFNSLNFEVGLTLPINTDEDIEAASDRVVQTAYRLFGKNSDEAMETLQDFGEGRARKNKRR